MHSVLRIDEVSKRGASKITAVRRQRRAVPDAALRAARRAAASPDEFPCLKWRRPSDPAAAGRSRPFRISGSPSCCVRCARSSHASAALDEPLPASGRIARPTAVGGRHVDACGPAHLRLRARAGSIRQASGCWSRRARAPRRPGRARPPTSRRSAGSTRSAASSAASPSISMPPSPLPHDGAARAGRARCTTA